MISLCMVVADSRANVEVAIASARQSSAITEVVLIHQSSSCDESFADLATCYLRTSSKGFADPDRQWAYEMASQEWIFALDSDERLPGETAQALESLIQERVDIIWFPFDNLCDGVDLQPLLGDDWHPRLFKKGTCQWPQIAHQYPQFTSGRHLFCHSPLRILHHRSRQKIQDSHTLRHHLLHPEAQALEQRFLASLDQLLTVATHATHTPI